MTSHKSLKSISHNFGHSFISLMNYIDNDYFLGHLLKQARQTKINKLEVNILDNTAKPIALITPQISKSIDYWNKWFPDLVKSSGSTMEFIKSATVTIHFDLTQSRPYPHDNKYIENPFNCETLIIDNRGKEYKYTHSGWWFPENN